MTEPRRRLDAELVRMGLAPTRARAVRLIALGRVRVDGAVTVKASVDVGARNISLDKHDHPDLASRGGHKLAGALAELVDLVVSGRRCLDAGASTGGFTDALLRHGAREVVAVDVGHDQLIPRLRQHPQVRVIEGCNVRSLQPGDIGGVAGLTVADLSFISLPLVLPALTSCTEDAGDLLVLVKPQFEVGRRRLGRGGVVRSAAHRIDAVQGVADAAFELGWGVRAATRSTLPGISGNVEFFLWMRRDWLRRDGAALGSVIIDLVQGSGQIAGDGGHSR